MHMGKKPNKTENLLYDKRFMFVNCALNVNK